MDRDTETRIDGNADVVHRFGAEASWFPAANVEANALYRFYKARSDTPEDGQHEVLAMLHLFF